MVEKSTYFELFIGESGELLGVLNRSAVEYERDPGNLTLMDAIFRAVHSLKGMAGIMEYRRLASFLHDFESLLDDLRKGRASMSGDVPALLFSCIDAISISVDAISKNEGDKPIDEAVVARLAAMMPRPEGGIESAPPASSAEAPANPPEKQFRGAERRTNLRLEDDDRERIFAAKERGLNPYEIVVRLADECSLPRARAAVVVNALRERGEVIREQHIDRQLIGRSFGKFFGLFYITELGADEVRALIEKVVEVAEAQVRPMDLESLPRSSRAPAQAVVPVRDERTGSTRVELSRLSRLMDVTGELLLAKLGVESMSDDPDRKAFHESMDRLSKLMGELQHEVLILQLVPIDFILGAYPRLVRDLATSRGKRIRLKLSGGQIGLDKRALDAINDPLVHLIRNAVGHGIESPADRA